ncbi:hypothetical protein C942_02331 [Photobacterium marinum]|uniref:Uncharacterized protein n=1 Tax=Photobacterium marinum TaxID=1056511 RepID=L8J8J0_9GAMM|nr:hypothetical protein [Photobacterium marinum]ELR64518.1 hypothetical protein C942_02331 [Photobacterium marinum]
MAAEKLTKARLIQILFLMTVLITAFVWRTVTYDDNQPVDETAVRCQITAESCVIEGRENGIDLTLQPFPAKANSELVIQIGNVNVKPVATVEGVNMYMGTIPVIFEQKENSWLGKFSVPECVHDKMAWAITLKQGDKMVIADFTVEK